MRVAIFRISINLFQRQCESAKVAASEKKLYQAVHHVYKDDQEEDNGNKNEA